MVKKSNGFCGMIQRLLQIGLLIVSFSSVGWSEGLCKDDPYCVFMVPLGQCQPPNNPYENGMKVLSGNHMLIDSWSSSPVDGSIDYQITVSRDSGSSLKQNVGSLKLHTLFVGIGPSAQLVCTLQVIPNP
jgi:hypothetical protein